MTKPYLSIVLPCRNQADHIGEVLNRYVASLDAIGRPYEIVIVPNACTDRTPEIVSTLAKSDSRFRVIETTQGGWGRSVRTGLNGAVGEHLCYTNSARTNPDDVVALFQLYAQNRPCIAKVRRHRRGVFSRELGSWLYNLEGRVLFGINSGDINGTPKIFSRTLWEQLAVTSEQDLFDMELMAKASAQGVRLVEMPVYGFRRYGGKSSTTWRSAWAMYVGAFWLRATLEGKAGK